MPDKAIPLLKQTATCDHCGHTTPYIKNARCPHCGRPLTQPDSLPTTLLERRPMTLPLERQGHAILAPQANVVLQFANTGACVSLELKTPLVLGRSAPSGPEEVLDLSEFEAYQYGVSRRHCLLRRQGQQLMINDLGSANGTYLSGKLLTPGKDYVVTHGDKLLLGRLPLMVYFSSG